MTERILNERYALESKVGEGGMAVTYRARDLLLNRTVAVKVMREQYTADPHFVERFRREAQAAARLSHENIAGVYDTGRADGAYYIVMELVEGTDLKQRLRRDGALPVLTALRIGRQIAAALDAAHRSGLVHRDIKPHNVLLNADGKVKVTDFGIAKLASDGEDTGVIMGSVHYLSPEQAKGEATTPVSDLYALGAVLFEMLTGRTVFEGENAMAVAHKQIYERPPLPRTLCPTIPAPVEAVVLRCLEKDPRARYQSAAEVQAVLAQLINQLAQEETVVLAPPAAPSMDATMVYRKPAQATAPAVAPPATPAQTEVEEPRGGGGWAIAILFVLLAAIVTYGGFMVFGNGGGIGHRFNGKQGNGGITEHAKLIQVPDLSGWKKEEALDLLKRMRLSGEALEEPSEDLATEGKVIRQDIPPATEVKPDTKVRFWVATLTPTFLMPGDLVGMSQEAAKRELKTHYKFKGTFEKPIGEASDAPKGQVIRTEPLTGTAVNRTNGKILLVLSTGAPPEAKTVSETFKAGSAPDMGSETVYVRIEFIRDGGDSDVMTEGTYAPGEQIPDQHFERRSDEKVVVLMYAGKDAMTLGEKPISEETFGPN